MPSIFLFSKLDIKTLKINGLLQDEFESAQQQSGE